MPETAKPPISPPVNLEGIEAAPEISSLTEATLKFEMPAARQAREGREAADAAHARLVSLLRLAASGFLLLGFFGLGVYLFAFKPDSTEAQKLYATTVLTAIASGSAGYAFGKKDDKPKD